MLQTRYILVTFILDLFTLKRCWVDMSVPSTTTRQTLVEQLSPILWLGLCTNPLQLHKNTNSEIIDACIQLTFCTGMQVESKISYYRFESAEVLCEGMLVNHPTPTGIPPEQIITWKRRSVIAYRWYIQESWHQRCTYSDNESSTLYVRVMFTFFI